MKNIKYLTRTALLLALALVFQIGFRSFAQPLVGPLVNMTLILSAMLVGTTSAVVIGCLTPLIAFLMGIMPMFPLVPFIMLGNALLVIMFNLLRNKLKDLGEYLGLIAGAIIKFAFLAISVRYLLSMFVPKVPPALMTAMSLPQLYTALVGGVIALIIFKLLPKDLKN